jgi:hypothetical protein
MFTRFATLAAWMKSISSSNFGDRPETTWPGNAQYVEVLQLCSGWVVGTRRLGHSATLPRSRVRGDHLRDRDR